MNEAIQIIQARCRWSTETTTRRVYQYNSGMILKIEGVPLPANYRVDFANSASGTSISVLANEEGARIPYEFFLPGSTIHAWVVVTGEDYVVTVYHIMIPIDLRAAPTEEEPTPEQRSIIDDAIVAMNTAVEQTAADVEAANAAAAEAAASAVEAASYVDDVVAAKDEAIAAKNAAETAQSAAEIAQSLAEGSERIAANQAYEAEQSASQSAASAVQAASSASAAATSEEHALNSETTAANEAYAAEQSANSAVGAAAAAATQATNAATSAANAAAQALAAGNSAAHADISATNAANSAANAASNAAEACESADSAATSAIAATAKAGEAATSATAANTAQAAAETAQTAAEAAASHYPKIENGYWYIWDVNTGAYISTGVVARGEQGPAGSEYTVMVQDEQPVEESNKLWIPINPSGAVQVPTVTEMNQAIHDAIVGQTFMHICSSQEYDPVTRIPTIQNPNANTFYLVPSAESSSPDLFVEWVYINNAWEQFGSATVEVPVTDVQVAGTSIVDAQGVANVPLATAKGIQFTDGILQTEPAGPATVKSGTNTRQPIVPYYQANSVFFGLAKAAGDTTQAASSNNVGIYTTEAKQAIRTMLSAGTYIKPANGIPASDLADGVIPANVSAFTNDAGYLVAHQDISGKADKTDTVLNTTLSCGRKANTTVGQSSFAFGVDVEASGVQSHAEGGYSTASSQASHAEGIGATASGVASHAEGGDTIAKGPYSHAGGYGTQAKGSRQTVIGAYNVEDTLYPAWVKNTSYTVGDKVNRNFIGYECIEANSDASFTSSKWAILPTNTDYIFEIGNGAQSVNRSNALAVEYTGDVRAAGDVYVGCNNDSTGGTKLAKITDIPDVPVTDVQVDGTSVVNAQGVANVPVASGNTRGVVKVDANYGLWMRNAPNEDVIMTARASTVNIKNGSQSYQPIVPSTLPEAVFYGLARAAGHDEKNSPLAVGTYTPEAKGAIQQMLGVSDLLAPSEPTLVASQAYAVGDVFTANGKLYKVTAAIAAAETIVVQNEGEAVSEHNAEETKISEYAVRDVQINGTSIMQNGVANVPVASSSNPGVVRFASNSNYGIWHKNAPEEDVLRIAAADSNSIKAGSSSYLPIVPANQHTSTFYGLAKAAGDTTQSQSSNAVGTYTDEAKAAIRTMVGAVGDEDYASTTKFGLIKIGDPYCGLQLDPSGYLKTANASASYIKTGTDLYRPIVPGTQHNSVFYGLAKAAGDTTQSASSNAVGTYTDSAKASIKSMLGIVDGSTGTVSVSGTTPTITAVENTRYVCGEVATLSITPPVSGICIVRFTSGTTATVLTATGVVWPEWFDDTELEASRVYEICITDGYGAVMSWAQ